MSCVVDGIIQRIEKMRDENANLYAGYDLPDKELVFETIKRQDEILEMLRAIKLNPA